MTSLRRKVLLQAFDALYGPLVFLHEPAGTCLFGPSWKGRRRAVAIAVDAPGLVLDIGCGSGHLLRELQKRGVVSFGIDRSTRMIRRARRAGLDVVLADVRNIPIADARVSSVLCTYPGPWIHDRRLWDELWRVTAAGSNVTVLIGGTVTRGPLSSIRRTVGRLAYGGYDLTQGSDTLQDLGKPFFRGTANLIADEWGEALVWEGTREDL